MNICIYENAKPCTYLFGRPVTFSAKHAEARAEVLAKVQHGIPLAQAKDPARY